MATIPVQDHMVRAFADAADETKQAYISRMATFGVNGRNANHVVGYLEGVADALRYLVGDLEITEQTVLSSVNDRYHEGL